MTKKVNYDLIGDIHGQALELIELLHKLTYEQVDGVWQHSDRKIVFLGDFVDRGKYQKEVIDIVKPMVEQGHALSVMGNHEYNAIAFYTKDSKGDYLREHSIKNIKQHKAFIKAYKDNPEECKEVIDWFKTLPLWLDLPELNVIHACWDESLMNKIMNFQDSNLLTESLLYLSADKNNWQYEAIETLLKGKEIPLPEGCSFLDKDKNRRHEIRIQWWEQNAGTYQEAFLGPESARTHIPNDPIKGDHLITYGYDKKPLFLGHYWMEGKPKLLADNIICLDYSVAKKGGKLVAYAFNPEECLDDEFFIEVQRPVTEILPNKFAEIGDLLKQGKLTSFEAGHDGSIYLSIQTHAKKSIYRIACIDNKRTRFSFEVELPYEYMYIQSVQSISGNRILLVDQERDDYICNQTGELIDQINIGHDFAVAQADEKGYIWAGYNEIGEEGDLIYWGADTCHHDVYQVEVLVNWVSALNVVSSSEVWSLISPDWGEGNLIQIKDSKVVQQIIIPTIDSKAIAIQGNYLLASQCSRTSDISLFDLNEKDESGFEVQNSKTFRLIDEDGDSIAIDFVSGRKDSLNFMHKNSIYCVTVSDVLEALLPGYDVKNTLIKNKL